MERFLRSTAQSNDALCVERTTHRTYLATWVGNREDENSWAKIYAFIIWSSFEHVEAMRLLRSRDMSAVM